jgi:cysteine-rich repeat protein
LAVNSTYLTPFEVQVAVTSVSKQGISILISSTSATQVYSLFVSYVVYDPNIQNLVAGNYLYNRYVATNSLSHTPPIGVSNNNIAFHGFSGFILSNNKGNIALSGSLIKGNFTFASSSNLYYLSYNYFYLIGGPCGQCVGFGINYNGNCVATCPPKSYFNGVTCIVCSDGQVWNGTACVVIVVAPPTTTTDTTTTGSTTTSTSSSSSSSGPSCPVGTYWDQQQLRCLPCPNGCSSCVSCYTCTTCAPGFFIDSTSGLCSEVCGDGKRYTLPCDDGNSVNGDGCSSTCQIENGWFCAGGSPASRDTCSKSIPTEVTFTSSGQSHQWGRIVLNVRANYLPLALVQSASDCANSCRDVLSAKIISGDTSAVSIVASYIPTTSFSFSVIVDFQKEPIGIFSIEIGISPRVATKYFKGIDISKKLTVNVNPAILAQTTVNNNSSL